MPLSQLQLMWRRVQVLEVLIVMLLLALCFIVCRPLIVNSSVQLLSDSLALFLFCLIFDI